MRFERHPKGAAAGRVDAFEFCGVRVPRSVPFYDTRTGPEVRGERAPWGEMMYSFGLAEIAEGLVRGWGIENRNGCVPQSIQWYFDARDERQAAEVARVVRSLRKSLAEVWREYRRARRNPAREGEGGGVAYRPALVSLCNYGGSVVGDNRHRAVYRFEVSR